MTVGGRDLKLDKAAGKSSLLKRISKYWVGMKAKLGPAVFFNLEKAYVDI